jgi:hypothetical protein
VRAAPNVTRPRLRRSRRLPIIGRYRVTDDAGAGSLRQAIIDAPDGATIQFDAPIAGQTIVLTTGELATAKTLTIEASAPTGMTISGDLRDRDDRPLTHREQ